MIHDLLHKNRPTLYVAFIEDWPVSFYLLLVPNQFDFYYHSRDHLRGTTVELNAVYWVARSETVIFTLMCFLSVDLEDFSFYTGINDSRFIAN